MFATVLLAVGAQAGPLDVALADRTGTLTAPSELSVGLSFKGVTATGEVETSWENQSSSSIAIACTDKGSPPVDSFVDKLMLQVGDDKWALAPGSSVKFGCPAGKQVSVTDLHGQAVGAYKETVLMTVVKLKAKADR